MIYERRELSASQVASRIGVSHGRATELMRSGVLPGRQLPSGEWLTSAPAIEAFQLNARRGKGRALSSSSAWGVLWELSGIRPEWLERSTLSRLRAQLEGWEAVDILRAVSGRTRETRFFLARKGTQADVIATGIAAAAPLRLKLRIDKDVVAGYVDPGAAEHFARVHEMVPDYEGKHVLYENTLPIPWRKGRMPNAVVACDLARSRKIYEREQAILALTDLKEKWIRRNSMS